MNAWQAAVLGVVQGATEFLPVSSSGHLVIAQTLMDIHLGGVVFEVAVHVATLLSVLWVYRARVAALAGGVLRLEADSLRYVGLLALATIPAVVVGLWFKAPLEALFEAPHATGVALLVTGGLLWSVRGRLATATRSAPDATVALLMGVAQAVALVPGISRSGATVVMALWLGLEAREAAAFSFLMAVPAILGAAVLQVPQLGATSGPGWLPLVAGGVAAAVAGVLAIRTFVAMLAHRSFHLFAPYCWTVGGAFLLYLAVG